MQYDYIIVGAGAAGCVLANRLTEDPTVRVALIEAGPDQNSQKTIVKMPLAMVTFMAPALAFFGGAKFMSWFQSEPEPGLQGRKIELPRGKGTGGSTNVNGQIFIRGQREDFDYWRDLGNQGWGYDDLLPYFKKVERFELLADAKTNQSQKQSAWRIYRSRLSWYRRAIESRSAAQRQHNDQRVFRSSAASWL